MKGIKKIAAIAGSVLMGTTMMTPVFAASLSNLPAPFVSNGVFDANIIVGSLSSGAGIASDMAGAMDIAAAFAQKAISEPVLEIKGIEPARINSTSGFIGYGDSAKAQEHSAEWMNNKTIIFNDVAYELTEKLEIINNGGAKLDNEGEFKIDFRALNYKISSNDSLVAGLELPIFGTEYQIVDIVPNNKIVFGEIVEEKGMSIPASFEIADKATVELKDLDSISKDVLVKVTASNGTVLFNDFMANNGSKSFDGFGFSLDDLRMFNSGVATIDAKWTSALTTLNNNGNGSALSSELVDWKVKITDKELSFSSPQSNLNVNAIVLNSGDEFNLMDYFSVKFEGFDAVNQTLVNVFNIADNGFEQTLSFEDVNNSLKSIALGSYVGQEFSNNEYTNYLRLLEEDNVYRFKAGMNDTHRFIEVFNQTSDVAEMTLLNSTDANLTTLSLSGAVYNLAWTADNLNITLDSWSTVDAKFLTSISYSRIDAENSKVIAKELSGNDLTIEFANSSLKEYANADKWSNFGTLVQQSSNQVSLTIPDERLTANIWYGRKTDGVEAKDAEISPINPGMGLTDIEVETLSKPTIIVGGGLANLWTQKLSDEGFGVSTDELFEATDKAYLELIEDAFGSSQIVLVVAGRDAKDTRVASQALAGHISGKIDLGLTGKLAWLDTSVEDYTEIKVI